MLWITLACFTAAAAVIYVIYAKVRDGTQPGEPFVDRLLRRLKIERAETPPDDRGTQP